MTGKSGTSRNGAAGDYGVGYGKPPSEHRFVKGVSGNPRGRPKKRLTVGEQFQLALAKIVTTREGNKVRQIPMLEAIIRTLVAKAAHGDLRAANLVLQLSERYRDDPATTIDPKVLEPADRNLLANYAHRVEARAKATARAASAPPKSAT